MECIELGYARIITGEDGKVEYAEDIYYPDERVQYFLEEVGLSFYLDDMKFKENSEILIVFKYEEMVHTNYFGTEYDENIDIVHEQILDENIWDEEE